MQIGIAQEKAKDHTLYSSVRITSYLAVCVCVCKLPQQEI